MDIKPGKYYYKRPNWDEPIPVVVIRQDNELFVKFLDNKVGVKLRDIPADAQFTKRLW